MFVSPSPDCQYNVTPLHLAAFEGHVGAVEALLDGKADVNAKNGEVWTG